MKLAKKANKTKIDRISELPDQIIHHIQSLLPWKEAARSCILSKTWKQLCSFYPVIYFDQLHFKMKNISDYTTENPKSLNSDQHSKIFVKGYFNFVEGRLSSVIHQNVPLRKLSLRFILLEYDDIYEYSSRLDHFAELITQACCVRELSFSTGVNYKDADLEETLIVDEDYNIVGHVSPCYNLKLPILTTKGLQMLSLHGCEIKDCYNNYNMEMYSSLRELYMSHVIVWQDAWDSLTRCCPSLEIIDLDSCSIYFRHLVFTHFPGSLKKVSLCDNKQQLERIVMTGTNLESLKCNNNNNASLSVDLASCRNIRNLSINDCIVEDLGQLNFYQDFVTIFPNLEQAHILAHPYYTPGLQCLIVASHHNLRTLYLKVNTHFGKACITGCPNLTSLTYIGTWLEEFRVDCPNLRRFAYQGYTLPKVVSFNASADMPLTKWTFQHLTIPNMHWFIRLRDFVNKMGRWPIIDLSLEFFEVPASFTFEEHLSAIEAPEGEGNNVKLNLNVSKHSGKYEACLFSHLLRSTYASTLTITDCGYDFIKNFYEKLSNVSEDGQTCKDKSTCSEHWWHHVEDYKVEYSFSGKYKDHSSASFKLNKIIKPVSSFTFCWAPI